MAERGTVSIRNLRSRICEARSLVENIQADARALWEAAPYNSFTSTEADLIAESLFDIAGDLGELEGD